MQDLTPQEEGVLNLRLSDLRTYLQCPRRFWLEVHHGLYPGGDTTEQTEITEYDHIHPEELVIETRKAARRDEGTMAHHVVKHYYQRDPLLDPSNPGYTEYVRVLVEQAAEDLTEDLSDKSWQDAMRYAFSMAHGFIPWVQFEGHDIGKRPLLVEERLSMDFPTVLKSHGYKTIRLTGQPDIVEEDEMTGDIGIGDTKTVQSLQKSGPRAQDFQLLGYALMFAEHSQAPTYGYQNLLARSLQTSRSSPPYYRRVPININQQALHNMRDFLASVLIDIELLIARYGVADQDNLLIPYSETNLCDWICRVVPVCDAMSTGSPHRWREVANEHFGGTFEKEQLFRD